MPFDEDAKKKLNKDLRQLLKKLSGRRPYDDVAVQALKIIEDHEYIIDERTSPPRRQNKLISGAWRELYRSKQRIPTVPFTESFSEDIAWALIEVFWQMMRFLRDANIDRERERCASELYDAICDLFQHCDSTFPAKKPESFLAQTEELGKAEHKAYQVFLWAESHAGKQLRDQEAYNLFREEGSPDELGKFPDLKDYKLPAFDTWSRQVRSARKILGEQKNSPRAGRNTGRSIVSQNDI